MNHYAYFSIDLHFQEFPNIVPTEKHWETGHVTGHVLSRKSASKDQFPGASGRRKDHHPHHSAHPS